MTEERCGTEIAVIGMAGRFPGAGHIDEFWENLKNGVESISFFSDEELEASGIPHQLIKQPNYIRAKGIMEHIDCFDAGFFKYTAREAEIMDPQLRVFHEVAWTALEDAGYPPGTYDGLIGLYAGESPSYFWMGHVLARGGYNLDEFEVAILNERDYLATRISYKLNLKGPSFTVQTACSTSLLAIHQACQALLAAECNMALAGGVSISFPLKNGYLYQEGMQYSSDGHCRAFDTRADGLLFGNGVGIVVLKTLEDALDDRDHIRALIRGSAVNNDGGLRIGFTAPAEKGQASVIRMALRVAEVEPETIGYMETHGSGTSLGDPIEIEALNMAFDTTRKQYCPIGSVKTNVGHLDRAAGITGFIKTVLVLEHGLIPPSLNFQQPNPRIDFKNSPFFVNTKLTHWEPGTHPRRAGISAFGIGGTNVHIVLEEAPTAQSAERQAQNSGRDYQLILLSAKTENALDRMTQNLAQHFRTPNLNLADAAYTLQVGRQAFPYRRMAVCSDVKEAVNTLSPGGQDQPPSSASRKLHTFFTEEEKQRAVIFMFAGLGDQYVNMAREIYEKEPLFQEEMNRCFEILEEMLDYDLKEILYPLPGSSYNRSNRSHESNINQTEVAQLVVFIIEYALARLLILWGIEPGAVIGYSFGEYAAACIAGVISLEDALTLVKTRGRLMNQIPPGAMLSVPLAIEQLKPLVDMNDQLSIAIDNGASCIVAGPPEAIAAFEKQMQQKRLICIRLETEVAVHSTMMVPILPEFLEAIKQIPLNPPKVPYISNVTGEWLTEQETLTPGYWIQHLRQTVRFSEGLSRLLEKEDAVFLEIGPGRALSTHLKQQENEKETHYPVVNLLRHPEESISDLCYLLNKVGHLWLWGINPDWQAFYLQEKRYRVPLPTYSFEPERFWKDVPFGLTVSSLEVRQGAGATSTEPSIPLLPRKQPDISQWFYYPSWEPAWLPEASQNQEQEEQYILIFMDECGLGHELAASLQPEGLHVIPVEAGAAFAAPGAKDHTPADTYIIDPGQPDHYRMLLKEIRKRYHQVPNRIFYLWGVNNSPGGVPDIQTIELSLDRYFYYLTFLARASGDLHILDDIHLLVVTDNMQEVTGEEILCPEKAPTAAVCKVISQEYSNITCRSIDIVLPQPGSWQRKRIAAQLQRELMTDSSDLVVVYRGKYRWVQSYQPVPVPSAITQKSRLRPGGVYLITGGLGGIGHVLAKHLAASLRAKLVLTGLTALPARAQWDQWLSTHPEEEGVSRKIRKAQELEALGAELLVFSADAANEKEMHRVISEAEAHFGSINGVIHAAGTVGRESMGIIAEIDKQQCQVNFQPKIYGILVLEKVLRKKKLDFCILMSSISSVLGGLGLAAYSAANLFMDIFARLLNRENPTAWISVNWDGWRTPTHEEEKKQKQEGFSAAAWEDFAMTPEEGIESFRRVLALESPGQVVHATGNLQARINQWLSLESLRQKQPDIQKDQASSYTRPSLATPYIAPRNQLETIIADVWQKFMGIDQVGIDDNFFDLNATSLDIVRINSILRDVLKRDIPAVTMFNYPTIAALARFLSQEANGETENDEESDRSEIVAESIDRRQMMRNRNVKRETNQ